MEVTVVSKVQGLTEFSSEGVSLTLNPSDLGLSDPTNPDESKEMFDSLTKFADYVVARKLYRMGLLSKSQASVRCKAHVESIRSKENGGN